MPNYKVRSSSCYGGNRVFYAGNIFKAHDVSEQDLKHLLDGGYIEETDEEATDTVEIPVAVVEVPAEDKPLLDPVEPNAANAQGKEEAVEEPTIDPAELLGNKNKNKNK